LLLNARSSSTQAIRLSALLSTSALFTSLLMVDYRHCDSAADAYSIHDGQEAVALTARRGNDGADRLWQQAFGLPAAPATSVTVAMWQRPHSRREVVSLTTPMIVATTRSSTGRTGRA